MSERRKGLPQRIAAARAGMSERAARKYEHEGKLPSQLKLPHDWQTRVNPFEQDWPWVVEQLTRDPALQGSTLFALLCEQHPVRYRPTQVRTLQRHIARWRALYGKPQEVIFEQRHVPGERAQSDFTHMEDLGVTIANEPFPHLVFHFVLTYSNTETASICFSESFEALAEGIEKALWQIGGVPEQHRTDHLSAAVRHLRTEEREDWTERYHALMAHYGMQPTWNNAGIAHENGDVEQAHHRFKEAVDQALRARGSRDFANRSAYEHFLQTLVYKRNQTRVARFAAERQVLRPLPAAPLAPCKELRVTVSRFSTISVLGIMRDYLKVVNPQSIVGLRDFSRERPVTPFCLDTPVQVTVRTHLALKKGWHAVIEPVEGMPSFGIESQRDQRAIAIRPLPAFGGQESNVHVRLDSGVGDAVVVRESQERDEVLGKGTSCTLSCFSLVLWFGSFLLGQQLFDQTLKVLDALLQLGQAILWCCLDMSRYLSM